MVSIPRNSTLAEALYRDIDKDQYLQEIYENLLFNYSIKLFGSDRTMKEIPIEDALRFSDLLSKSTYTPTMDRDRMWGQEIAILMRLLYHDNETVRYYLGSALSAVGNFRGLLSEDVGVYSSTDLLDQIFYGYDKEEHRIPGKEEEYFFHDQLLIYRNMGKKCLSYSGPTSMGKSFVVQTYVQEQIKNGSTENFAILVPTKALINEVRSNIIGALKGLLNERNYRVVTAAGDLVLKQDHHFIFVMTPERLLHMMIESGNISIDLLFIDEAHKISSRGGRSAYYYKVLTQLKKLPRMPMIVLASPNIPNPEVYLGILPKDDFEVMDKLATKFAPVCQFKYYLDMPSHTGYYYNDYTKMLDACYTIPEGSGLSDIVRTVSKGGQSLVYCSSRRSVLENAVQYARSLPLKNDDKLKSLATEIKAEVHDDCYLADLILKGVAYHVGYLPANIRLRIERSFEAGDIRTIFCTSTLIEGVNLPADNLFITSYRNGKSNMEPVEFKNLIGRVGRIKYNLYGNVVLVRENDSLKEEQFVELLKSEVPPQKLSIDIKANSSVIPELISDLARGDIEMKTCHESATENDFEALRKFGLIYTRDLATGISTPITDAFDKHVTEQQKQMIIDRFPIDRTSDDITLSYDQSENLHDAIANGLKYPDLSGEDDDVDFDELVKFMMELRRLFKWDIYEKQTLGKVGSNRSDSVIRWYSTILLRWIRGNGLRTIVDSAVRYKEKNPSTGVWSGQYMVSQAYDESNLYHKNLVIAESLSVIENVLLFSISNYFRKVSLEYKAFHGVDHFDNDWYEYVEYGTTNPNTIFFQQNGFSREASIYIQRQPNFSKYVTEVDGIKKIKRSILTCGNLGVETEAQDIQFNIPELFVD